MKSSFRDPWILDSILVTFVNMLVSQIPLNSFVVVEEPVTMVKDWNGTDKKIMRGRAREV